MEWGLAPQDYSPSSGGLAAWPSFRAQARSVAQPRPLGLALWLQKVAARALLESALADLLPQAMNGYALRRALDISLVVMPLRILVEKPRSMGDSLDICCSTHRLGRRLWVRSL